MSFDKKTVVDKDSDGMDLDRILVEDIGQLGKHQLKTIALCMLVHLFAGYSTNDFVYTTARIRSRCIIPECETASNFAPPWILNAVPAAGDSFDNCRRFANSSVSQNVTTDSTCPQQIFDRGNIVGCDSYVYEDKNSAVYDFNLACDEWRRTLIGSVSVLGMMFSLPITGYFSDRFGRRLAMSVTSLSLGLIGLLKYWAHSYEAFIVSIFVQNLTGACSFSCAFILAIEYVGPKHRAMAGCLMDNCMALGATLQGCVMWAEPYWRHYILIISAPQLVAITYFWISPESVRWLISKGRFEEAKDILIKAAETNGRTLSEKTLMNFKSGELIKSDIVVTKTESSVISLVFQHKTMILRCLVTPVWWITVLLVYYGLTISSVEISGNKYLNYVTVNLVEIPGVCAGTWFMNKYGRKPLLIGSLWICGACQIIYIFIPKGYYAVFLPVYLVGKMFISAAMFGVILFTVELYPTRYRTSLMCYSSMVGRLGALVAPLTPALASMIWEQLPFALFGGMVLLSGLLVMLAPETLGKPLPDTMEGAANLGKDQSRNVFGFLTRKKCYDVN